MKTLKIGLAGVSLVSSLLVAGDDIAMQGGSVVVRGNGEAIVLNQTNDMDGVVVNDKNIVINSQRKKRNNIANHRHYAYSDSYAQPERVVAVRPDRDDGVGYRTNGVIDMSYDTVEVKHSNQYVGTAEVPVVYQLHPLTVHQYK